jgi:hypothetical protein
MRNYSFPIAAVFVLLAACTTPAAEKPRPKQGEQTQTKKVWTNEDLDQLRARGLISIVGQDLAVTPTATPAEQPAEPVFPVYESRLDDPDWYAQKAADLQAQLDLRVLALQQEQQALAAAKDRVTQPGVAMNQPSVGVTPDGALDQFQAQVQEIQSQLDELSDLARQHNIEPGVLRS